MSEHITSGRPPLKTLDVNIVGGSTGDGAITDGADSNIKATVLDYTNTNPVAVRLTDTNGDYVAAGAGTQYTEDAAAAANPVGNAIILVREDARGGSLTTTDGDNVAARGNNKGEMYVKTTDSDALLTTIDADTSNISTKIDTVAGAVAGTEMQVDIVSSALPTGAATSAKQDTIIGHVDGIEGLLTTIDADTGNIDTKLGTIDTDTGNIATSVTDVPNVIGTDGAAGPSKAVSIAGTQATGELEEVRTDADGHLQVDVLTAPTTTVQATNLDIRDLTSVSDSVAAAQSGSWSVTANAGTNLNTSALALETGGNLAAAATSLAVIDDWDETDRAKVNVIAGQVGITAGAGAVAANTPRVTLASDDPAVTSLQTLDNAISGSEMQVDVVGALPAGTNAIGKLAANSGVDIGDVDVTSIIPGTGATNLGKAEDSGHTSTDVGVMPLGVRVDTPNTALTNTDADYSPVAVNKLGSVRVACLEDDFAVAGSNHVKKYYTNAGAVTDGIVWSPAAGKRWYVTDLIINVSAAATVTLEDDLTAGDAAVFKAELAANSGIAHTFNTPLFSGEDAADLLITTSAGNVYVSITGYEI